MTTTGERIRKLREDKGWSLRTLATKVDVNYKTIYRIERDETSTTVDILSRIAKALDATICAILGEDENTTIVPVDFRTLTISDVVKTLEEITRQPLDAKDKTMLRHILEWTQQNLSDNPE